MLFQFLPLTSKHLHTICACIIFNLFVVRRAKSVSNMKTILLTALFLVILFVMKAENAKIISRELHFDDRKLHRVIPKSGEDLIFLKNLRSSNFGILFWNGIGNIGEPVDLLTTPSLIEQLRQKYPNVNLELTEVYSKVTIAMSQTPEKLTVASECKNVEKQPMVNNENILAPMNQINGTDLYTGVYYKVGMKTFPQGWITWTTKRDTSSEAYFWQIDLNPNALPSYETGGSYQKDNQWTFGGTEIPRWYTFANRGVPNGLATWSNTKLNSGNHLIVTASPTDLDRLSAGGESRNEAFWSPVATNETNFYQLALKSVPEGKVTWSYAKYGNYSHYMIVATKEEDMPFYQPENKWYDDTLFRIELGSKLLLEGTVFDFQFGRRLDEILKENSNEVNSISRVVNQFNIPNRSSVSETLEINEAIVERKRPYAFKFEDNFFDFISKTKTDFFDENGCEELKCAQGGLCTKVTDRPINIKTKINIPKDYKGVVSVETEWVNAVKIPFIAKMKLVGMAERLHADGSGNVDLGIVPADFIERFFKSKEKKVKIVYREDEALIVEVSGKLSGMFALKNDITPQFI